VNLISKLKKSVAADSAATANDTTPIASTNPVDDLQDLDAIGSMLQRLQARNVQYQRGIDALIAARRIVKGWDVPKPELRWSVERDVLVAVGDAEVLAAFDRDHADDLAREQEARKSVGQQVFEAPARITALEQHLKNLATEMKDDLDEGFIHDELVRLFTPSAQRMLVAAKAFVQAWREMQTMESALTSAARLYHYSLHGDLLRGYDMALIDKTQPGDLLPTLIEGLDAEELRELNWAFTHLDSTLYDQLRHRLVAAGLPTGWLKVIHPGAAHDDRPVYAEDPKPPRKHLDPLLPSQSARVRIDVA